LGDDAVRDLVRVRFAFAAFLPLRPSAQLGVRASCAGLGARCGRSSFTSGLSGQLAAVWRPFVTAIRAFHVPDNTTANAYDAEQNQSSPLPKSIGDMETDTHKDSLAGERTRPAFTKSDIGCVIDGSSQSADYINAETIDFAKQYGFDGRLSGYFDGTRGQAIEMTWDDAQGASHQGECDEDVAALLEQSEISAQFDAMNADDIRAGLKEYGAWNETELADDHANRLRALWSAACDIRENGSQMLSELADDALDFLNGLDGLPYCSFYFEDNSLFYAPCVENVQDDVETFSDQPADDYEGEWLHVNDHGNATLYVRSNGEDKEIWGVV
jgi:hypothetical protein